MRSVSSDLLVSAIGWDGDGAAIFDYSSAFDCFYKAVGIEMA